jgi:hypothetical protein
MLAFEIVNKALQDRVAGLPNVDSYNLSMLWI